jgi:peptide/nickel transport system substrate-binding protein
MVRLASFQAGEADILLDIEPRDAESLKASGDYAFSTCFGRLMILAGDSVHEDSPFADIKVRQAIQYAVDREPVVEAIGCGYWQVTDQMCGKQAWGYNPTPSPYSYDPQKAKELLAQAGYPDGLNVPMHIPSVQPYLDFYTAIHAQLNEAGFNVNLDIISPAKSSEYVLKGGWNNALFGDRIEDNPNCLRAPNIFSTFGRVPFRSIWYPPEVDDLVAEALGTADFEIQKEKAKEINALTRDKYCTLTTLATTRYIAVRYPYVHDDGCFSTAPYQASLQDAWMEK